MRIPLVDVAWQHQHVAASVLEAVAALLQDPFSDAAPHVARLEEIVRERLGVAHAIAVQSGTAAEFLILKALGIGPGDEVITVPNSDMATAAAISHTGARPVFVDVDRATHQIDPDAIAGAVSERTKAIVPVHMYGHMADMDAVMAVARRYGLRVIEDAAIALGASANGRAAGTIGDAGFFSLGPRKVVGGTGNGGIIVTNDDELAYRVRVLRGYGQDPAVQELPVKQRQTRGGWMHVAAGHNLPLDGIQAIVAAAKLAHLDKWQQLRQEAADLYSQLLKDCPGVTVPVTAPGQRPAWRNYTILVSGRDAVRAELTASGIASGVLYTPPLPLQPAYAHLGHRPGDFPVAEELAAQLLCLPMHPGLTREAVTEVVSVIRRVQEKRKEAAH